MVILVKIAWFQIIQNVQSIKSIFSFFRKRVVNIVISDLRPVSNERSGNFTFYRSIHEFLNSFIFEKNNGFLKFYAVVAISQKIL